MKRISCCLLGISLLASCGGRQPQIDRTTENGVEVIQNHLAPYVIKGEPTDFRLEEELTIDFAGPAIGEMGLANATDFMVDARGFI